MGLIQRGSKIQCKADYHSAYLFKDKEMIVEWTYSNWVWVIVPDIMDEGPMTFSEDEVELWQH